MKALLLCCLRSPPTPLSTLTLLLQTICLAQLPANPASVDVGPAHWIWLNSYFLSTPGSAQYDFFLSDLQAYAAANRRGVDGPTP